MIWIIGFAVAGLIIGLRASYERIFLSMMGSVIGGMIGFMIAAVGGSICPTHLEPAGCVKLVSLRDADEAGGRFFLGSGYVASEPYYFYYRQLADGSYAPGRVPADHRVIIREEERSDAVLEFSTLESDSKSRLFGICLRCGADARYLFIVPKGTVQRSFSLR